MRHENPHYSNEIKFDDSEQKQKNEKEKNKPRRAKS